MSSQPLYTDNSFALEKKDDRSQNHLQEIPSHNSCDTQEEVVACLERIRNLIKDNLAEEEHIDDPAEVVLDRLVVSLDWTLVAAVFFMLTGILYLRSTAFATFGDGTTHQLLLKMTQNTNDTATNDILLALLAQTPSPESPRYTLSRELIQTSVLSSCFFAFLMILGKLLMDRNGLSLNMPSRHRSRRQSLLGSSPITSRWLILILKALPNAFLCTQLLLGIAFIVAHHLAM